MWPGTISLSAARFPGAGTALFGMLALAGDLGCSLGPWPVSYTHLTQPYFAVAQSHGKYITDIKAVSK